MNFHDLEVFLSLVKTKSFTRTAEALHLSQPTVTVRIRNLEESLGQSLFIRNKRSVELSESGKFFLPFAQRLVSLAAESRKQVASGKSHQERLVVGMPNSIWSFYLVDAVVGYRSRYPNALSFVTGHSWEIIAGIQDGTLQLGFSYQQPATPGVKSRLWRTEKLVLIGHKKFVARVSPMKTGEILKSHLIRLSNDRLVENWLAENKLVTEAVIDTDQMQVALDLVLRGQGVAFLPESLLLRPEYRDLERLKLGGVRQLPVRHIYLATSAARRPTEVVEAFLGFVSDRN